MLGKSRGIAIGERVKRVELMEEEEVEFVFSGLAEDTSRQIEVGQMLSTDYLVFCESIEMGRELPVSVRMTDVESGEVVFQDSLSSRATRYEYIAGYFTTGILGHFRVPAVETTKRIDPGYDAAQYYLNKINLVIPEYQPEYSFVGLTNNPALAGMVDEQMVYFRASTWERYFSEQLSDFPLDQADSASHGRFSVRLGWIRPLAPTLGIQGTVY